VSNVAFFLESYLLYYSLCITAVIRCIYINEIFFETYDVTWVAYEAWAWTSVEAHMAVMCASAPALKVFFKQYLQVSRFGSSLSYGFRRAGYRKTGHGSAKSRGGAMGSKYSASAAHSFLKPGKQKQSDIEIGHIEVTQEVDVMEESSRKILSQGRSSFEERLRPGLLPAHVRK